MKHALEMTSTNYANLYLSWANDFLTLKGFADHYGVSELRAYRLIVVGRRYHKQRIEKRV